MLTSQAVKFSCRSFNTSMQLNKAVKNLVVIGGGLMGSGIAQVSAQANLNVVIVDQNNEILQKSQKSIEKSLSRFAKKKFSNDETEQQKFIKNVTQHIRVSSDLNDAVKNADLIIEAVVENIAVKQSLLNQIENVVSKDTIVATNTSSLQLSDISAKMKHKERFGGLHFFNPVPLMKLLEVVRGKETSDAVFNDLLDYGRIVGKTTVSCKDTPGFIVNRLLVPYMYEALALYERGDAEMKDIDTAMKLGASYPMGPFELADYVGLDTLKFIQDGWRKKYGDVFKESQMLNKLVKDGKLGVKSGEGFYKYNK